MTRQALQFIGSAASAFCVVYLIDVRSMPLRQLLAWFLYATSIFALGVAMGLSLSE